MVLGAHRLRVVTDDDQYAAGDNGVEDIADAAAIRCAGIDA